MASKKKVLANRKNALKSTGPKTEGGKTVSAKNSTKHGLNSAELSISEEAKKLFEYLSKSGFGLDQSLALRDTFNYYQAVSAQFEKCLDLSDLSVSMRAGDRNASKERQLLHGRLRDGNADLEEREASLWLIDVASEQAVGLLQVRLAIQAAKRLNRYFGVACRQLKSASDFENYKTKPN